MKANVIKIVIAIALAMLLGVINYTIASDNDYRNWISFGVTTVTMTLLLILTMGIDYNCGYRTTNIKLVATIGTLIVLIGNIVFSCFMYIVPIYLAVMGIISLIFFVLVYTLIPKDNSEQKD